MLGLGVGFYKLAGNDYPVGGFSPDQIENLSLWLKFNTDISGADGEGTTITTDTTPYPDGEAIRRWADQSGNDNHAVQTNGVDMPLFEADEPGAVNFASSVKFMDLTSNIQIDANTDFTAVIRFKCVNFSSQRAFLGSASDEFFRLNTNKAFRLKIGSSNSTFAEGASTMATDTYYTVMVVRSNGSTGNVNVYVRGGAYTTGSGKDWDAAESSTNTGQIDFDNIGAAADDANNFNGFMKDVLVYDGTALDATNRELLFDYLESQ